MKFRSFLLVTTLGVVSSNAVVAQTVLNPFRAVTGTTAGTLAAGDDARITGALQSAQDLADLASAAAARVNLGLGSMALQDAAAVSISSGNVGGITLGSGGDTSYPAGGARIEAGAFSVANAAPYGWQNTAVGLSVVANANNPIAQVMGGMGTTPSNLSNYASRDKVVAYFGTMNQAPWTAVAAGYTATSVTLTAPIDVTKLRVNMLIDAQGALGGLTGLINDTDKFTGAITGWNAAGTVINVSGWYRMGNSASGQVPLGSALRINPSTKLWSLNSNVDMWQGGEATAATGYELGINNHSGADDSGGLMWGMDVVNLGGNRVGRGYLARGELYDAFAAYSGSEAGFLYQPQDSIGAALLSRASSGALFQASPAGHGTTMLGDSASGSLDLGAFGVTGASSSPAIRFHTTGGTNAEDAMIAPSGGVAGSAGQASLTYTAASHQFAMGSQSVSISTAGPGAVELLASSGQSLLLAGGAGGVVAAQTGVVINAPQLEIGAPSAAVGSSPYIDMHYGTGTPQDYNVRITNDGDGQLSVFSAAAGEIARFSAATATVPALVVQGTMTPASASSPCAAGQINWDQNYFYVCVATNTWKRASLASW